MPYYMYRCGACGHELGGIQAIKDKPLRRCPKCKRMKLARVIAATTFVLKGSGWARDGYVSRKEKP